jgi:glyoxylase-like metal-dependent hydrolase (beta-lactamase superfamily II)
MVRLIDSMHLGSPNVICIALVEITSSDFVMIDSGPESVFESVVSGIEGLGIRPRNIRRLLLSHIHLDHSGGAWRWAKEFGTQIYVHPRGAPHLIDPDRLVASATRIYGEKMEYLWGKVEKVPSHQVTAVEDGNILSFGDVTFHTLYTPGHAQHHNAYWLPSESALFAGDVAGVAIGNGPCIPPCPPPEFHLETWRNSLDRMRALAPGSIYITHFGKIDSPTPMLDDLEQRLFAWADWMKERIRQGKSDLEIVPEFEAFTRESLISAGVEPEKLLIYERADPSAMSVSGLVRYWKKYHPEQIQI